MVYHLGNASHLEAHTGHTAGHGLHQRVGQIVLQRRQHIDIGSIVYLDDALGLTDIAQRIDRQGQLRSHLFGVATENGHHGILLHLRMVVGHQAYRIDKILHALARVGDTLRHEKHHVAVFGQA